MALAEGKGIRPSTRFWRGPDFQDYHENRTMAGGRKSLRCVLWWLETCPGRCSVSNDYADFRLTTGHNHDPDRHRFEAKSFRHALMERCRSGDHTGFKKMYREERRKLRISRQAASRMPLEKLRSSMRRARLENRPRLPHSIKDLNKLLSQRRYKPLTRTIDGKDNVYAGKAGSASRKTMSAIFTSRRMLRYMNKRRRVKSIFCDATFCPVPRRMKASQVWTISTVRQHHVIPLVRVLMRKRTAPAYAAALEKIKELAPEFKPQKIMSDFERGEQRALEMAFPNAQLYGCLFHYAKAIGCKARNLGMTRLMRRSNAVRRLVRWLSCLPLLPTDKIKKGFRRICKKAIKKNVSLSMIRILRYWKGYWLHRVPVLSVSGCPDRTNNAAESDNRMLQDAVQVKRPNVWDFLDGVIDLEDSTCQDLYNLGKCRGANRKRSVSAVANDRTVTALTTDLEGGHISVREFLKAASFTIVKALSRGLRGKKRRRRNV